MALIPAGITGSPRGRIGKLYARQRRDGSTILVPRARHDKRSPAQIEQRRRFRLISSYVKLIYLSHLKRLYKSSRRPAGSRQRMLQCSLKPYQSVWEIPLLIFGPAEFSHGYWGYRWSWDPVTGWKHTVSAPAGQGWEPGDILLCMVYGLRPQRLTIAPFETLIDGGSWFPHYGAKLTYDECCFTFQPARYARGRWYLGTAQLGGASGIISEFG